ncbi:hypothetical protein GC207_15545 [bacterium]|nr:hypothetical protein [bacterium]
MNSHHRFLLVASLTATLASTGCRKSGDIPSDGDPFEKAAQALEIYLGTNALDAEAAMLDLEKFIKQCEKSGNRDMPYAEYYASTYSRLYRVQRALGKTNDANQNYQRALEYWQKEDERRGLPKRSKDELGDQIEGKGGYWVSPQWEKAK